MTRSILTKSQIATMIPHQGAMCLLEAATFWNETELHCRIVSHLSLDNPLRREGKLNAINAIEYAGQAIALHRYLLYAQPQQAPKQGYLAAIKQVEFSRQELSDLRTELLVIVKAIMASGNKAIYEFLLSADDITITKGQLIVSEEN